MCICHLVLFSCHDLSLSIVSHQLCASTSFIGAKVWNSLPDELRLTKILKEFKNAVRELHL